MGCWNDYMGPLIYASSDESMYTVGLGIYYNFIVAGSEGSYSLAGELCICALLCRNPSFHSQIMFSLSLSLSLSLTKAGPHSCILY